MDEDEKVKIIFLSVPMRGYTDKEIKENLVKMKKFVEIYMEDESFVCIDNYTAGIRHGIDKIANNSKHPSIYYLSRAIELMSGCDMIFGPEHPAYCHGCSIEASVAEHYEIPLIPVPNVYLNLHKDWQGTWMPAGANVTYIKEENVSDDE